MDNSEKSALIALIDSRVKNGGGGSNVPSTRTITINGDTQDLSADRSYTVSIDVTDITGNAGTATKLQTARNINGVSFDGTADINLTPSDIGSPSGSGSSTGSNTGDQTLPVGGTPSLTLGIANSAGSSPNFIRDDDTILVFDTTAPSTQNYGDTAAMGVATVAARRDHKHSMPASTKDTTAQTGVLIGNGSVISSVTAPSGTIVGNTDTQTLTNKRKQPRVYSTTSDSSITPEIATYDCFEWTALAAAITINNHSTSTPGNFEKMQFRFLDNGTPRAISWGNEYVSSSSATLPTTTVISTTLNVGVEWRAHDSKFVCIAVN